MQLFFLLAFVFLILSQNVVLSDISEVLNTHIRHVDEMVEGNTLNDFMISTLLDNSDRVKTAITDMVKPNRALSASTTAISQKALQSTPHVHVKPNSRIWAVGDFHSEDPFWWNCHDNDKQSKLVKCFSQLIQKPTHAQNISALVMLGDLLDYWHSSKSLNVAPESTEEFLEQHRRIEIGLLAEIAKDHNIDTYIVGGDFDEVYSDYEMEEVFPNAIITKPGVVIDFPLYGANSTKTRRIKFAHGNELDFFDSFNVIQYNNPTWKSSKVLNQPFGYYLARLYSNYRQSNSQPTALGQYYKKQQNKDSLLLHMLPELMMCSKHPGCIRSVVRCIGVKLFLKWVFAAVKLFFWKSGSTTIATRVQDQIYEMRMDIIEEDITLQYVRYADAIGNEAAGTMIEAGLTKDLQNAIAIDRDMQLEIVDMYVAGHTHTANYAVVNVTTNVTTHYVNVGCWGIPHAIHIPLTPVSHPFTFSDIQIDNIGDISIDILELREDCSVAKSMPTQHIRS